MSCNEEEGVAHIVGIDHLQMAMPAGGEFLARKFYGTLLGLPELGKAISPATGGTVHFQCGSLQLHLIPDAGFRAGKKNCLALMVHDLVYYLAVLTTSGYAITFAPAAPGHIRAVTTDPFGNRIELMGRHAEAISLIQ